MKVPRSPHVRRMCRRCARAIAETEFPGKEWVCADCVTVPPAMPLTVRLGHEQYDTSQVFAGLQVRRVKQGDSPHQWEAEVPCRLGVFFPAAENVIGFEARSGHTAMKLLRQFPGLRLFTRGDDGSATLHVPVELFEEVAAAVGVRRKRRVSPERREALRVQAAKAREALVNRQPSGKRAGSTAKRGATVKEGK